MINCDAHHVEGFNNLHFGVATACRGWANVEDVVNTQPLAEFEALLAG
jgi:DNA polymerase (family 10)